MRQIILACETVKDELNNAMRLENITDEVYWIKSGLHNYPNQLRNEIQSTLDSLTDCNRVITTFGLCGNALIGVKTHDFEMIVPKVDDCISLFFGSVAARLKNAESHGTYFLTKGWLGGERTLWAEYQYSVEKYGDETADSIMSMMLANYKRLGILDTKSYDIDSILPETKKIAQKLGLLHEIIPVSVDYIRQLLKGPWDNNRFLINPKFTEIKVLEIQ
jgi:hypothetical protein